MDVVQAFHLWRKQNGFLTALEVSQTGHDASILAMDDAFDRDDMAIEFIAQADPDWQPYLETLQHELSPNISYWATDIVSDFKDPIPSSPLQPIQVQISNKGRVYHTEGTKKPKKIAYRGIVYDSKTEAVWACIFDKLGLQFHPQPEHGLGVYWRPDFCMMWQDTPVYVEVKYGWPTAQEEQLALQVSLNHPVFWLLHPWDFTKKKLRMPHGRLYENGRYSSLGLADLPGANVGFTTRLSGRKHLLTMKVVGEAMNSNEFSYPDEIPQQPTVFRKEKRKLSRRRKQRK